MHLKTLAVIIENLSHLTAFKLLICNSTQNHISYLSTALDLNLVSDLFPDGEHGEKMLTYPYATYPREKTRRQGDQPQSATI